MCYESVVMEKSATLRGYDDYSAGRTQNARSL